MKLTALISATLLGLTIFATQAAQAEYAIIACYADTAQGTLSFNDQEKYVTYIYSNGCDDVLFEGQAATTEFSQSNSYVTIERSAGQLKLRAQIIGGDPINPIIDSSVELVLNQNDEGQWILTSGYAYHLSQPYSLDGLIGHSCYVP